MATTSTQPQYKQKKSPEGDFLVYVAGLGVGPSLWDYEPHVHRTLSRAMLDALKRVRSSYSHSESTYCNILFSGDKLFCTLFPNKTQLKQKLFPLLPR
jgi:hypothetical protein